jgi:hypothetical protein
VAAILAGERNCRTIRTGTINYWVDPNAILSVWNEGKGPTIFANSVKVKGPPPKMATVTIKKNSLKKPILLHFEIERHEI